MAATAFGMSAFAHTLRAAAMQASTPAAAPDLQSYGYPTLDVTVTSTGYEGIPAELSADRYLVTVTPSDGIDYGAGVGFVQPNDMSVEAFLAATMGSSPEASPEASVAPVEASPATGGASANPLDALLAATFAGGAHSLAGEPMQVVLDLTPGQWIAWAFEPEAPQQPVSFTVTGNMPGDPAEPAASATLAMSEYDIAVSQGALTAGTQVIKVENIGAQPHFLDLYKGPDSFTEAQVETVLNEQMQAEMTGTPPGYSDLNPDEDFDEVFVTTTQSTGIANWFSIDLESGTYMAICFFPGPDGVPHAYHGMYSVIGVE